MSERVITLFGEPEVTVDGRPVELGPAWPLLAILLLWRQSRPIRMADVVDRLMRPDSEADDPGSRFRKHKQTVQTLLELPRSRTLADIAEAVSDQARVDVALFDKKIESADSEQVREAVQLRSRGPLLASWQSPDIFEHERSSREKKYQKALRRLIQEVRSADPKEAVGLVDLLLGCAGLSEKGVGLLQEERAILEHEIFKENSGAGEGKAALLSQPLKLPNSPTELIGREGEKEAIRKLLSAPGLVTLTGTAGIGKTRLAIALAQRFQEDAVRGVAFADLTSASGAQLPQRVGLSLGMVEMKDCPWSEALPRFLEDKNLLLVWDNCEHLVEACAALATDLLAKCSSVRILATSREPLRVYGERRYLVPLLSLPERDGAAGQEAASRYDAPRLFTARAAAVRPDFCLTAWNSPTVLRICRDLDGLPLAIELAASLVDTRTLEQIATALNKRFELLVDGPLAGASRHRSLRAAFDVSYDRLEPGEKELFQHFGVFVGGFSAEAVEAVLPPPTDAALSVPHLLPRLVRKSLVIAEEHAEGMRFRLLETVRQYAEHRLIEGGEDTAARWCHADWFLHLAEEAEPPLTGANQKRWLDRLEVEHDNLRAAMTWYAGQEGGSEKRLRLADALSEFWRVRGYLGEGRRWLTEALRCGPDAPASVRARALNNLGSLALFQGDFEAARGWCEESLTLAREAGDTCGIGRALHGLGSVAFYQGSHVVAREKYEECLTAFRQVGDKRGATRALNNLGGMALYQNDLAAAWDWYEECLSLSCEMGDKQTVSRVLLNLGSVAFLQGSHDVARERYEESLSLLRDIGDKRDCAYALNNVASIALQQCDFGAARAAFEEGLALFQEVGDRQGDAYVLAGFASLAASQNQSARAGRLWGAAEALRETVGVPLHESDRERYDQEVSGVREALGEAAFAGAWAVGRAMTWGQVVALALKEDGA